MAIQHLLSTESGLCDHQHQKNVTMTAALSVAKIIPGGSTLAITLWY